MQIVVSDAETETYVAKITNQDWLFDTGSSVNTSSVALDASGIFTQRTFYIRGTLTSSDGPTVLLGDASLAATSIYFKVESTGTVSGGGNGIVASGGKIQFVNSGTIDTTGVAASFSGPNNSFKNDGLFVSDLNRGLAMAGTAASIDNNGTMKAWGEVIYSTGSKADITNAGTINSLHGRGVVSTGSAVDIANGGAIVAASDGIYSSGSSADINSYKSVRSTAGAAIRSTGDDAVITLDTTVTGRTYGLYATGDDDTITNRATLSATAGTGLRVAGDDTIVNNIDRISGLKAVQIGGDGNIFTNNNIVQGLSASGAAVLITGPGDNVFTNNGAIKAKSFEAILAGSGDDRVTNTSSIYGNVRLGSGNDYFNGKVGEVTGKVYGGKGDDLYELGGAVKIVENAGEGHDTVKIGFSYTLGANVEDLVLTGSQAANGVGNALANRISSNRGNNQLTGKGGADTFVFDDYFAKDRILDFEDGKDHIDLKAYAGISKFSDISSHMKQVGSDVVLTLAHGDQLTIEHIKLSHLTSADFLY